MAEEDVCSKRENNRVVPGERGTRVTINTHRSQDIMTVIQILKAYHNSTIAMDTEKRKELLFHPKIMMCLPCMPINPKMI